MSWLVPLLVVVLFMPQETASLKVSRPHLADVNILLPPKMAHPVEYRLQGIDGCFKWSWDDHDVLTVLPEYNPSNHCSTSARLRSIAPYNGRKETTICASDVSTGIVITCKVYIDYLSRIQIFHTSVKLDLDGIAILRVCAFDKEDNMFTSLAGLQFTWEHLPETDNHLVHVPLKDSPLTECDVQINLEDSGVYSDIYVVKGIGIGHGIVSVHLLEHHWKDLADKIVLTVAKPMSLHSQNVNLYSGLNDQVSGRWSNGNESIFPIRMSSGRAAVAGQDSTQAIFKSSSMNMQTTDRVVTKDSLVDAPKEMLTNVPLLRRGYEKSVKLRHADDMPRMDRDTGNFLSIPYSPDLSIRSVPRLKDMRMVMSVSIPTSHIEANQVSRSVRARFIEGFLILERNVQENVTLNLSRDSNRTSITLGGNTVGYVEIHVYGVGFYSFDIEGPRSIKIRPIREEDFGIGDRVVCKVKALKTITISEKMIIAFTANCQRVEIYVNFRDRCELATLATNGQKMEIDVNLGDKCETPIILPSLFICFMLGINYKLGRLINWRSFSTS